MFSGIVEAKARLLEFTVDDEDKPTLARINVEKPKEFNDLTLGDSVAVNGICLTVEAKEEDFIQFAVGAETLKIVGWDIKSLQKAPLNLERSLKWSDRVHGHLVSGHIDALGEIVELENMGESRLFKILLPSALLPFVWKKGSLCVNGVSLTINEICGDRVEVCIIPETLKRTNLGDLQSGDFITIEVDQMARGLSRLLEFERQKRELYT